MYTKLKNVHKKFTNLKEAVYKIVKDKTNYLYSIGDYTVINWINLPIICQLKQQQNTHTFKKYQKWCKER